MSNASESPAGAELWRQARTDYEAASKDLESIAATLGLNRSALIAEARRRGWALRGANRNNGTRATLQRFKELLTSQLGQLEGAPSGIGTDASSADGERHTRTINTLVRTLEKVLELERKDRAARARKRKARRKFDDAARDELARRLTALHRERESALPEPVPVAVGSSANSEGLAELGAAQSADSA